MKDLTDIQKRFILTSCNLRDAVFDFGMNDYYFKKLYGCSKAKAIKEISILQSTITPRFS